MKQKLLFGLLILAVVSMACGLGAPAGPESPAQADAPAASPTSAAAADSPGQTAAEPEAVSAPLLPTLQAETGQYIYTNANVIHDIAQYNNLIFAGGTGGLVSWDIGSGTSRKFTTLDGLRHISIYAVEACNMPEPRIVIGHELGVDLLNPTTGEFESLRVPEENDSLSTKVGELYCDQANDRLLLGYSGVGVYDFKNNTYTRFTRDQGGLSWDGISGLTVIGRDIWVLTGYNGANVIAPDGKVTIHDESTGMPSQRAYSAARTSDGTIWVGTSSGLLKFRGNQWTLIERSTSSVPGEVNNLFAAADGTLWLSSYPIGTGRICQFDPKTETCSLLHEYPLDGVAAFELVGDAQLIFYGTRQGLQLLKPGEEKAESWLVKVDEKLRSNFVSSMALDGNNQLWVGTGNGIHIVNPADPETDWTLYRAERDMPNLPGGNWASALIPAENDAVWAVFTNGQLSYFDGAGRWTVFDGSEYYSVRTVGIDPQGRAWVVKRDQPVFVMENGEKVAEYTTDDGLPEGDINVLFRDGDTLWIGGNGLARFKDGKIEPVFNKDEMGGVVAMSRDKDGSLLVARFGSLIRLDENNLPTVLLKGEFGSDIFDSFTSITGMAFNSSGTIYLGTSNGLLISEDNGASWVRITTADGITTNYIRVVFVDQYDTLWLGGGDSFAGGGLMRYVP
ncbi:MAG TPA: hypothetical protein DCG54_08390 [Anaerolineae bacterium]|jgi:ligand-binding sensor domain-containing protein|nr:hypothetical protein [Anaerolineae bacterium]